MIPRPRILHVVAHHLGAASHQDVAAHAADLHGVIRHQSVAALDERQRGLALAHAAVPLEEHPDSEHLHQDAVDGLLGRENGGQHPQDPHGELRGGKVRLEDGAAGFFRDVVEIRRGLQGMREHAAGDGELEELLHFPAPLLLGKLLEKGVFPPAEDLDALVGEVLIETAQLEPRPVDLRDGDLPDETRPAADTFQVEGVVLPQVKLEEIEHPELLDL